jgi:protein ImuB
VAVVYANRVVATSPAARAGGARVGMRRREAEGRCAQLEVLPCDLAVQARRWEPVIAAVEAFSPGVEVLQPGQLALSSRGPSRYFGGDAALAAKVVGTVEAAVGSALAATASGWEGCCRAGIADGIFAAGVAAHRAKPGHPIVVAPGESARFLAGLPVKVLALDSLGNIRGPLPAKGGADGPEHLVDLLGRLGLKKLGDFAALPPSSVVSRFGPQGLLAHHLARGQGQRTVKGRAVPPDWTVSAELDPPADQLQAAIFVGRALADELHQRLSGAGLVCTRLAIEAETENGISLRRSWRHDGALSAGAIGERVRWQLEGWASSGQAMQAAQAGPVSLLRLVPEQVRPDDGRQLGFWGGDAAAAARAARALARAQGLLGPEAAVTAVLQGGRDYAEQVLLVPWGEPREPARPAGPWPGRLPGLAPALVHQPALPAEVVDQEGKPVTVAARGGLSGAPAAVAVGHNAPVAIGSWAGPWPVEERWWDAGGRRRARFQVCTADGRAFLLAREKNRWWVEATYD